MALPASSDPLESGVRSAEALAWLEAAMRQLRDSRRRLETHPVPGQGGDDALIYIQTAEMHLRAARCRLAEAIARPVPRLKTDVPVLPCAPA